MLKYAKDRLRQARSMPNQFIVGTPAMTISLVLKPSMFYFCKISDPAA
jgi:hypothetical protein